MFIHPTNIYKRPLHIFIVRPFVVSYNIFLAECLYIAPPRGTCFSFIHWSNMLNILFERERETHTPAPRLIVLQNYLIITRLSQVLWLSLAVQMAQSGGDVWSAKFIIHIILVQKHLQCAAFRFTAVVRRRRGKRLLYVLIIFIFARGSMSKTNFFPLPPSVSPFVPPYVQ